MGDHKTRQNVHIQGAFLLEIDAVHVAVIRIHFCLCVCTLDKDITGQKNFKFYEEN